MFSRLVKTISFVVVALVLQTVVLAAPATIAKLKTRNNKAVKVNGQKATTGTSLVSGSNIQTPDKVGATVDMGLLGRLDIAPNTEVSVTFGKGVVSVQLRSGYVVLTTNKGVSGTVNSNDGEVFKTDSSKNSSVIAKTKGVNGPQAAATVGASNGGINTGAAVGIAGAGSAVVGGAAAVKSNRGSSLSTDNPRQ